MTGMLALTARILDGKLEKAEAWAKEQGCFTSVKLEGMTLTVEFEENEAAWEAVDLLWEMAAAPPPSA